MAAKSGRSRVLRQLAEDSINKLADDYDLPEHKLPDLVTSLVRQWVTYHDKATLFLEEDELYLRLGKTPLGKLSVIEEPVLCGWMGRIIRDWEIDPEEVPEIIEQLNRGQSAEVTNAQGIPLRLWVNPEERGRGVEPLVKQPRPSAVKRDYHKIAADVLAQQFGPDVEGDELEALAGSVVRQWRRYEGVASIFLETQQLVFVLTELAEGHCRVDTMQRTADIRATLLSLGVPPELVPEAVVRMNRGQDLEYDDGKGARRRLWHDSRAGEVCVETPGALRDAPPFCPSCGAVLSPWGGDREQACPLCGHTTARP